MVDGKYTDNIPFNPKDLKSKDKWNCLIDQRLMEILEIPEQTSITAIDFCKLALAKLKPEQIRTVWRERPKLETTIRIKVLISGFKKYIYHTHLTLV